MPLAMLSSVYKGNNQSGASKVYGVSKSSRYNKATSASLSSAGFLNNISSARVNDSTSADAHLILFKPIAPFLFFF